MARLRRIEELSFRRAFWAATIVTVVLWMIPFGDWVIYPLSLLGTFTHELGHGIAALLAGGRFEELVVRPDLSGVARASGVGTGGGLALMAAGGLLFPAVAGFGMLLLSARQSLGHVVLGALAAALVLSLVLWVRGLFGIVAVLTLAAGLGYGMWRLGGRALYFLVILISLQVGLSGLRNWRYLFSSHAGAGQPSDTAQLAQALGGSAWLWGALVLTANVVILGLAYRMVRRRIDTELERYG